MSARATLEIKVLLFASLRERAGTGEIALALEPGASVAAARTALCARFPNIVKNARAAAAVNGRYVKDESVVLNDGDELAFLPPVSGG